MARSSEDRRGLLTSKNFDSSNAAAVSYGSIRSESVTPKQSRFLCTKRDTIVVVVALTLAVLVITTTLVIGLPKIKEKEVQYYDTSFCPSSSPLRSFAKAAVVADGKPCAAIGKAVLEKNGSAVDAAIASLFCNGVVTPQSMGLGGGFFMVIYSRESGQAEVIDARETAPAAATEDMFHSNATLSKEGGLSVAVPGELKGYWDAHRKYGTLNWDELIMPSVEICEKGFEVSEHMASRLKLTENSILSSLSLREEFFNNATGEVYKAGEIIKRPRLAETLRTIASQGASALYAGVLTKQFVQDIQDCGGILTEADLKNYSVKFKKPLRVNLDEDSQQTLYSVPPPASGAIFSLILNVLQAYNFTSSAMDDHDGAVLNYHRMVESFKFAFAQRKTLADEDFAPMSELITNLTSKKFASEIHSRISDERTYEPSYYEAVLGISSDHGTSQVSVLAPNGDAVSVTSTINTPFGSRCLSPSTGILLNNNMDDFASPNITNYFGVPPFSNNFIKPGKRPLSSMTPSIMVNGNGDVGLVVGGMGGTHIITACAQTVMRMLWLNADCKEAIDAPRLHHQLYPNQVSYEKGFPKLYLDRLKKFGHVMKQEANDISSEVLLISRKEDTIESNVDYRKGGSVDGF